MKIKYKFKEWDNVIRVGDWVRRESFTHQGRYCLRVSSISDVGEVKLLLNRKVIDNTAWYLEDFIKIRPGLKEMRYVD